MTDTSTIGVLVSILLFVFGKCIDVLIAAAKRR